MNSIEREAIILEMEPHDIAAIQAASLWELCRSFDAEAGAQGGEKYVGLRLFKYFKQLMQTRRVSNYNVHSAPKEEAYSEATGCWV